MERPADSRPEPSASPSPPPLPHPHDAPSADAGSGDEGPAEPAPGSAHEAEAEPPAPAEEQTPVKLFLGGLSLTSGLTPADLRDYFSRFGEITEVVIKPPSAGSRLYPRGARSARAYAFITVADAATAEAIVAQTHTIKGCPLLAPLYAKSTATHHDGSGDSYAGGDSAGVRGGRVGAAGRGGGEGGYRGGYGGGEGPYGPIYDENGACLKCFAGGLGHDVTEASFRAFFEKFGRLTDSVIMHDHITRRPRGFGFVTFAERRSVDALLSKQYHDFHGRRIEVKLAIPREECKGGSVGGRGTRGGGSGGGRGGGREDEEGPLAMDRSILWGSGLAAPGGPVVTPEFSFETYAPEPVYGAIPPMGPMMQGGIATGIATGIPVQHGFSPPLTMAPGMGMLPMGSVSPSGPPPLGSKVMVPPPHFGAPPPFGYPPPAGAPLMPGGMLPPGMMMGGAYARMPTSPLVYQPMMPVAQGPQGPSHGQKPVAAPSSEGGEAS